MGIIVAEDASAFDLARIITESTGDILNEESLEYLLSLCDTVLVDRLTPGRARSYARELLERVEVAEDET